MSVNKDDGVSAPVQDDGFSLFCQLEEMENFHGDKELKKVCCELHKDKQ